MTSSLDQFNFDFDTSVMQQDLSRVEQKPGQSLSNRADKYVIFPKGEGSVIVRILPPDTPKGRTLPYASTRLHYMNGRSYHCLRELEEGYWRGDCPACNYYNALYRKAEAAKTIDEADAIKTIARKFKPIERYYYNVIVRKWIHPETGETRNNVGPLILSVGKSLHGRILRAFLGNKKLDELPLGNIFHPTNGRDFKIIKELRRSEGREFPNYDQSRFEDESILGDNEQIEKWLFGMWDLEAERTDNLKTHEEVQDQIEYIQGKKTDPSIGFDVDKYDLPAEMTGREAVAASVETTIPTATAEVFEQSSKTQDESPAPVAADIPFDLNLDGAAGIDLDADWVKDLQKEVSK